MNNTINYIENVAYIYILDHTDVIGVIEKDLPLATVVNRFGQQQKQIKFNIVDGR